MAARLGNILYWLGIILGAIALMEALLSGAAQSGGGSRVLMGALVCGVGWAARHILAGSR